MNVLDPMDASGVYRDLHRAATAVGALASVLVSIDPSREPPNRRATRTLEDFVAYKSVFRLIRGDADLGCLFDEFSQWKATVHCDGPADPRALPLHVFELGGKRFDLACDEDTNLFRRQFGAPNQRKDAGDRLWRAGVAHGHEELSIGGQRLPAGTHWDVSSGRRSWRIVNAREVWRVEGHAYLNAYPDEHLRAPRTRYRAQARRVWHAGTKNAPRSKTKGH